MATMQINDVSMQQTKQALHETFGKWERQKLIDYAVSTTRALSEEKEALKNLTNRYNSAQNWALGLALVEEIGQNLASTLDLNEVLTRLLQRVYSAIDVEDGSILLIEEPSGDLVTQVVLGSIAKSTKPFRIPQGQGIAGEVATTGTPIIVNEVHKDPRHFKQIDQETGFQTRSILCVPILTHEKIIGVLEIFNKKSGPFSQQDQVLLSSIANYAGIAIENARLHQSVVAERDRVISAQEEVSHHLQRDLHDGPTQLVAAIQMGLDFCRQALQHNEIQMALTEIEEMNQLAQRATHQMRTLLFELRPLILETQGLVPALSMFIERRQTEAEPTKLQLICRSDQPDGQISRLGQKREAAIFAIAQESVSNALKHAQAENITVSLKQAAGRLTMIIADDGYGFDVSSIAQDYEGRGSYGMFNLRERVAVVNGEYKINSAIGQGTEIRVEAPVDEAEA